MGFLDDAKKALFGDGAEGQIQSAEQQPAQDRELVSYIKNKVEESRGQATRIAHEGIWMTNIAYLLGFDSIFYDPNLRQFRPAGNNAAGNNFIKRNRIHENILLPACQNRLARMLKSPPKYDVRPNSMDEDDKEAARLGIEIINSLWDRQQINRKRIDLGMWLQQCGHAYVCVSYDDQIGDPLVNPETGETMGYEGDVRVEVVSAFEGFADPLAKTFEDAFWFARCKVRKLDYFRTRYPERGALVKEEGVWLLSQQYEMRINTLNTVGPSSSGTSEQMKGAAVEIVYYEKRSQKYPNGRHIVVANGVLLENKELAVGEIPYAKFDDIIVAGKYFSETPVTHCRPLQDQYNRSLAKRADWVNKLLAGKYIAARGHGLIQESMNDQSGEIVEYDPVPGSSEPKPMQLPVIPQYAYQETAEIKKSVYDIFGLSEVSRGQLPSASIPAKGIDLLLEQDETRIGIEVEEHEHSWARVGMLMLKFVDKCVKTDRKLKTKGKSLDYTVRNYNGDSLMKNFDVTVIRGSTVPNSKILKRQDIMNLYRDGLLGNPQDPSVIQRVLGMLEYGDVGEAWKDYHLNMGQVQKTIDQIEQGIVPVVDEKDNHIMHMTEKNYYRLSEKFDLLPPPLQMLLQADIHKHLEMATLQMNPGLAAPPEPMPPGTEPPPPDGGQMGAPEQQPMQQ